MGVNVFCYTVTELDRKLAKLLANDNGLSGEALEEKAYTVAILRGLYDAANPDNLLVSDEELLKVNKDKAGKDKDASWIVLKAWNSLQKFRSGEDRRRLKEMKNSSNHLAKAFKKLTNIGWSSDVRSDRINMIATLFTAEVNRRWNEAASHGIALSRLEIVNGHKQNGNFADGQFSIFESIFDDILGRYTKAVKGTEKIKGETIQEKIESIRTIYKNIHDNENIPEVKKEKNLKVLRTLDSNLQMALKWKEVMDNWAPLCAFARMRLRNTEGLKLGNTLEYAMPTTPDDFTAFDAPLESSYQLDESTKEAWMQIQKELSAFGCMGAEVRKFISTIPLVNEDGKKVVDDLGFSKYLDPIYAHSLLTECLRGVKSESTMISILEGLAEDDAQMEAIIQALSAASGIGRAVGKSKDNTNPTIVTQLLLDMHKNLIPYSGLVYNRAKEIVVKILNRKINPLRADYILFLESPLAGSAETIYKRGNIDWGALANWSIDVDNFLPVQKRERKRKSKVEGIEEDLEEYDSYDNIEREGAFGTSTNMQKKNFLVRTGMALGIWRTEKTAYYEANALLRNKKQLGNFLIATQKFNELLKNNIVSSDVKELFGTIANAELPYSTKEEKEEAKNKATEAKAKLGSKNTRKYKELIKTTVGTTKTSLLEHVNTMLDAVSEVTNAYSMERRITWFDRRGKTNSLYSDRTPSYMGDLVETIHSFVAARDAEGLKNFIMDKWGNSTFFYDKENNRFRNIWLQELYESLSYDELNKKTRVKKNAFAQMFSFDEFLGASLDRKTSFENFSQKRHAEAMIKQFLQPRSAGQRNISKYPCFILGDSGVQMFFTAKRYTQTVIMKGLMDVFAQEFERMKYVDATNQLLMNEFVNYHNNLLEKRTDDDGRRYEMTTDEAGKPAVKGLDGNVLSMEKMKELGYDPIDNFSEKGEEFTMLTFLNSTFKDGKYWKILTGEDKVPSSKAEAMEKARECNTEAYEVNLQTAIETYMNDSLKEFKERLVSLDILKKTESGNHIISKKSRILRKIPTDKSGYVDEVIEDFFWNTKYATIQQLQLFTVDPAFYDKRYPIKDLQKRYKEIYAPGKSLSVEAKDYNHERFAKRDYQQVVYFKDIEVSTKDYNEAFYNAVKDAFAGDPEQQARVLKAFRECTLTDGQGYRTLDSYRAVKGMAGEWTRNMEDAYNEIKRIREQKNKIGEPLTDEERGRIAELAVIFQPIKPFMYTLEQVEINNGSEDGNRDVALIPVQHKYAEIVLIPELLNEGKLKDLAVWMEENDIDMAASSKCVKVGAFGSAHLSGKNTTDDIYRTMDQAYVHRFNWEDYRIQSGVPEHLNQNQLYGTQIRKLILHNMLAKNNYAQYARNIFGDGITSISLPGFNDSRDGKVRLEDFNGNALVALYNSLIMSNEFDSYQRLFDETNSNEALADKLLQNIISNSRQAEDNAYGLSLIEDDAVVGSGEFLIPLGEPGMEHDTSAFIFSLIKQEIIKQRIKGGSAVQASALGISGYEEVGDLYEQVWEGNVVYEEVEMPFKRTVKVGGEEVELRWEDWCNSDGTLKLADGKDGRPLRVVKADDPNVTQFLSWPVSGRKNVKVGEVDPQGYYVPLIETKYKGILDLVAYRIPSEKEYSVLNGRVFRFTNPLVGGILKRTASRTSTDNSDFDIDKEYFFIKEYVYGDFTDEQVEDIWKAIYNEHPEWREALKPFYDEAKSDNVKLAEILAEKKKSKKGLRYYHFWKEAGLPGEASQAFADYLERHPEKYMYETYNPNKPAYENSRAARNNLLIDIIKQRLADKDTLKDRYTPGGFETNKDAALLIRVLEYSEDKDIMDDNGNITEQSILAEVERIKRGEKRDPEPDYDVSDPTAILVYNQQNQAADKLIGIFANQNTNYMYSTIMKKFKLLSPIKFGSHASEGLSDLLNPPVGVDVSLHMAELLAASVDAVKAPVLNFENLNPTTANPACLLTRLGYTPREVGLLLSQPILKDVCEYIANNDSSLDIAISEVANIYGSKFKMTMPKEYDSSFADKHSLYRYKLQSKTNERKERAMGDRKFIEGQLHILKLFQEIVAVSNDLNLFVQSTRFTAANSVGSTWGAFYALKEKMDDFVRKYTPDNIEMAKHNIFAKKVRADDCKFEIELSDSFNSPVTMDPDLINLNARNYIRKMVKNPFAFEQCTKDLVDKAALKIFSRHFPYETKLYSSMRGFFRFLSRFGALDADTIDSLHREFVVFLLNKVDTGGKFDMDNGVHESFRQTKEGETVVISNRDYYLKEFPMVVSYLISNNNYYPLLRRLSIESSEEGGNIRIVIRGVGGLQSYAANDITAEWADAFQSDEVISDRVINNLRGKDYTVKELAEDLFFYNLYRLGFNFHPTSSISLSPTVLRLGLKMLTSNEDGEIGYIDFINSLIKGELNLGDSSDIHSLIQLFAKQYILNHLDNGRFTFVPSSGTAIHTELSNLAMREADGAILNSFTVSTKNKKIARYLVIRSGKITSFTPVVGIRTKSGNIIYYMASGKDVGSFNTLGENEYSMEYRRVTPQGKRGDNIKYFKSQGNYERFQEETLSNKVKVDENVLTEKQILEAEEELPWSDPYYFEEDVDIPHPEDTHSEVELGQQLDFSKEEWDRLFSIYKKMFDFEGERYLSNIETEEETEARLKMERSVFESIFKDTSNENSVEILNKILSELKKGKKFKTLNKRGEETDLCS